MLSISGMSCSWSALLPGLTACVSLKSTISIPHLRWINGTLIRRSLYLNGQQLTRRCGGAGVLIFKLAPLSGLLSPVTNTLVRVKLRLEVEAGHPLIISWLLVFPNAILLPPLVTFWPFHRSEMSINPKDGWPGSCIVCLISDIPCLWDFFFFFAHLFSVSKLRKVTLHTGNLITLHLGQISVSKGKNHLQLLQSVYIWDAFALLHNLTGECKRKQPKQFEEHWKSGNTNATDGSLRHIGIDVFVLPLVASLNCLAPII